MALWRGQRVYLHMHVHNGSILDIASPLAGGPSPPRRLDPSV